MTITNIYVSPAEPQIFRDTFQPSTVPEEFGMDFIIPGAIGLIGIQRKTVADFLASQSDGRLVTQLIKSEELPLKILLFEGQPKLTADGYLFDSWGRDIHVSSLNKMLLTMRLHGYWVVTSTGQSDTIYQLDIIRQWAAEEKHTTGFTRPNAQKTSWGRTSAEMLAVHVLSGWPSIGQGIARNIYETFGCIPLIFSRPDHHLLQVPQLGKRRLQKMKDTLDYGDSPNNT